MKVESQTRNAVVLELTKREQQCALAKKLFPGVQLKRFIVIRSVNQYVGFSYMPKGIGDQLVGTSVSRYDALNMLSMQCS